jgi:hypothetical protein
VCGSGVWAAKAYAALAGAIADTTVGQALTVVVVVPVATFAVKNKPAA